MNPSESIRALLASRLNYINLITDYGSQYTCIHCYCAVHLDPNLILAYLVRKDRESGHLALSSTPRQGSHLLSLCSKTEQGRAVETLGRALSGANARPIVYSSGLASLG